MVKVIGLTGSIGAGKGVVSDVLEEEFGYTQLTVGDVIRSFVKSKGLESTRDNCDKWSEIMRQSKGVDYWMKQVVNEIKEKSYKKVIVDGVRLPSDNEVLKNAFKSDYVLFKVDASPIVRFKRLKKRARPGFPKTLEEFKKHEQRQNEMFNLSETFKQAEEVIDNSSTLEDLEQRVKKVMKKNPAWV